MKTRALTVDGGFLAVAAVASLAFACNLGPSKGTAVTVALPLSCAELEGNARRSVAATFIAVAGAEFPPITEYRNQHPCSREDTLEPPDEAIFTYDVRIPDGDNRALAIAVLGEPFNLGLQGLPDVVVRGIPLRTENPRPVFFGGGMILKKADLEGEAPRVQLTLEPFVNMIGRVERGGEPATAKITFFAPELAFDGCLETFEDDETTSLLELYSVDTARNGAFLASVPYRATATTTQFGIDCDNNEAHGNEVFAFAHGSDGAVALFVPGRADGPDHGRGLEPGIVPGGATIYLRNPEAATGVKVVTGISHLQGRLHQDFYITGYAVGSPPDLGTVAVNVKRESDGTSFNVVLEAQKAATLGEGPGVRAPLPSYSKFRVFGDKNPFVMRLSTTRGFAPGRYTATIDAFDGASFTFLVRE